MNRKSIKNAKIFLARKNKCKKKFHKFGINKYKIKYLNFALKLQIACILSKLRKSKMSIMSKISKRSTMQ